jgi:hypothetical protein
MGVRKMLARRCFQELLGVLFELRQTVMAAKKISLSLVNVLRCSAAFLYVHTTNWIFRHRIFFPINHSRATTKAGLSF